MLKSWGADFCRVPLHRAGHVLCGELGHETENV